VAWDVEQSNRSFVAHSALYATLILFIAGYGDSERRKRRFLFWIKCGGFVCREPGMWVPIYTLRVATERYLKAFALHEESSSHKNNPGRRIYGLRTVNEPAYQQVDKKGGFYFRRGYDEN
jgi:hypothetical protein